MKKSVSRTVLLLLCLVCCLLLTGCYQDRDPWPASDGYTQTVQATLEPRTTVTPEPLVLSTSVPTFAPTPTPEPVLDLWNDGPTEVPGGSVEPGFNG